MPNGETVMSNTQYWLGIDVGSVGLKIVLLDGELNIAYENYTRTNGRHIDVGKRVLAEVESRFDAKAIRGVGVTGSGAGSVASKLGGHVLNEVIAHCSGLTEVAPHVRTAIEIGGQDAKLLIMDPDAENGPILRDFSTNSLCAAGTGSFLDQQATRLGVKIEDEFEKLALSSEAPPRIAGRCSVFAKSDMIHLQQIATPVPDIAAGLCLALARSFKATVGKGYSFKQPVAFLGGVASNGGMVRAFEEVLGIEPGELIVPEHHATLGAYGAALVIAREGEGTEYRGVESLDYEPVEVEREEGRELPQLRTFLTPESTPEMFVTKMEPGEKRQAFIGIDVGSISTNVVVLDTEDNVLSKCYLRTASRPIRAVRTGLREVAAEIADQVEIMGIATTGSGRYLTGELVGADVIRNEITAQATAAILIDPEVDTIFEIGGQDSKYISLDGGTVREFEMNRACAAGTGSFLEEQAERLDVDLKTEFSKMALDAESPVELGDRCTVFMESDLIHHQQAGAGTPDLLAGLGYSIVHNYLNRVVGERRVGERIFFQGGTAFNKAVVAAFNQVTGKTVVVPPHHEVTGAIGAALLAKRHAQEVIAAGEDYQSRFRGWEISEDDFEVKSFTCKECENVCEIRTLKVGDDRPVYYGSRCEKYDIDRHADDDQEIPDLFTEREALLLGDLAPQVLEKKTPERDGRPAVGIPMTLAFHDYLPFWRTFFDSLGYQVILSGATSKRLVRQGVEEVVFETCFPVKVAHGHIKALLEQDIDLVFLPSMIDAKTEDFGKNDRVAFNCPMVQTIPYTARSAMDFDEFAPKVFSPILRMQRGLKNLEKELTKHLPTLNVTGSQIRHALNNADRAQEDFYQALEHRGQEIIKNLSPAQPGIVLVSRPYNGCDNGLNLDLPKKLRALGVVPIPMDMLSIRHFKLPERWNRVYWRYGQRILKAAEVIKANPNMFAVFVTNFSCGPDSFILEFFAREMKGKPYLQLEIDEHSADAGLVTRCEAFLDTLGALGDKHERRTVQTEEVEAREFTNHRTLYLPNMTDHAQAIASAFRAVGQKAVVMDESDSETVDLGRRSCSGRECYPCLLTSGDMLRQTKRPDFDRDKTAFFMASADGPCRFGQYNQLHRQVLDRHGFDDIPIFTLDQGSDYRGKQNMSAKFERIAARGVLAIDGLQKLLHETRPYETNKGDTNKWFENSIASVCAAIESGDDKAFYQALKDSADNCRKIPVNRDKKRPLIGVVGEVYVRTNSFANDNIIQAIEDLGGEVIVPTLGEWFRYVNYTRSAFNKDTGKYLGFLRTWIADKYIVNAEHKIYDALGIEVDPAPQEIFEYAKPYLDKSFQGEAILTIGASVEYIVHRNVAGIVNTMPFTCMPGSICTALLRRVRQDYDDIPVLNASSAGQKHRGGEVRGGVFTPQPRQYDERHSEAGV